MGSPRLRRRRLQFLGKHRLAVEVAQGDGERAALRIDLHLAEELVAGEGELFWTSGAFWNITCGPNVPSSALGPKLPALRGPATNSQNGAKSLNAARSGL